MAYNDEAVVKIATAHFYLAPKGTAAPANPLEPGSEWEDVGHTTLDSILSMSSEGGEKSVLGSLQNRNLRTSYADKNTTFNFAIHQFDDKGLKLYLGSNAVTDKSGRIGPADTPAPTNSAWLVVVEDGDRYFDFYAPSADIIGSEDLSLDDTESLASLPLSVTPLRMEKFKSAWFTSPVKSVPSGSAGGNSASA